MMGMVSAIHEDTGYSMAVGSAAFLLVKTCISTSTVYFSNIERKGTNLRFYVNSWVSTDYKDIL